MPPREKEIDILRRIEQKVDHAIRDLHRLLSIVAEMPGDEAGRERIRRAIDETASELREVIGDTTTKKGGTI